MKPINLKRLLISIAIPLAVGGLSTLLTGGYDNFQTLTKPPLSPPAWLFPIVWTILYILMGIAAYNVTDPKNRNTDRAMGFYYVQLAANFLWPLVFFSAEMYALAAILLIVLILLIIATMLEFGQINRTAALLLIPYLLWCAFALYLNIGVAVLN